jgi:hypothetical protein
MMTEELAEPCQEVGSDAENCAYNNPVKNGLPIALAKEANN